MTATIGRRLSLSPLTMVEVSPPEMVTHAAAAGFDSIGVRVYPGGTDTAWPMLGGGTPMMRDTLRRLNDTGMQVLDVEVLRLRRDKDRGEALQILDAAAELNASYVLVNCNEPDRSRLLDQIRDLCHEAHRRQLKVGLEFMVFSDLKTLPDAYSLVQEVDDEAAVIVVDALHLQRSGGSPAQLSDIPTHLVPYAQLCDGPLLPMHPSPGEAMTEARSGRLVPGAGALPLRELLQELSPSAAISVEAPFADAALRTPAERARTAFRALESLVAPTSAPGA